jgi:hypothetical protein
LKAVNCQNGDTLAQEQVPAVSKEKVLDTLGEATSKLREQLGESLASVHKLDVPLEQAAAPSDYQIIKLFLLRSGVCTRLAMNEGVCRSDLNPNCALVFPDPISNKKAAEFKERRSSSTNSVVTKQHGWLSTGNYLAGMCWSFTGKTNGTERALAMKTAF